MGNERVREGEWHAGESAVRFEMSAPGRNRTCGLLLRRQTLYPLSYGGANSDAAPLGVHSVTHLQPVMDSGPEYPAP